MSIMDFLPTFASIFEVDLPTDRPVDGIDQLGYLTSEQSRSHRENVLTFVGPRRACGSRPMAYLHDGHAPLGQQPELGGYLGSSTETAGYPMILNIEADPREMRNVAVENSWVAGS